MAPLVNGAAVYRRRRVWPGNSRAFGRGQWPWRTGWGAHRRLSPGRVRGKHGGSTRLWGALGARSPPAPAQPEEIPDQRRQQAGPLARCGGVRSGAALSLPPLSYDLYLLILLCAAFQNCTAVPYRPFCQLWSSWLTSLLVVRPHISVTGTCTGIFPDPIMLLTASSLHQDRDVALKPGGLCVGTRRVRCRYNTGMEKPSGVLLQDYIIQGTKII